MSRHLLAATLLLCANYAHALSVVCSDASFPRHVSGAIDVVTDASQGRVSYTVLLPDTYEGAALDYAELHVQGPAFAQIRTRLATQRTEVADWRGKLITTIHAQNSAQPMTIEASYGFPCRWVLTTALPRRAAQR